MISDGMKYLFLTNQASYHQMHFARAMAAELGVDNFRIVFEKGTSAARAEMGWKDDYTEPYIIRFAESDTAKAECHQWIADADVVIQGRFPIKHVRQRIYNGKLTFACQERLWKKPPTWYRKISRLPHLYKNYYSVNKPNYHFLAIGAYAAKDLNDLGVFKGRSWKYGYFIDCPSLQAKARGNGLHLLWCARFSEVKQPYRALEILQALNKAGLAAKLTMIGDGELRPGVEQQVERMGLAHAVSLTGWQTQEQVFEFMDKADLFLMTSDQGEGWGLVVNEALSHGCGVVANRQLGAAQWLIKESKTGFLYDDDDLQGLIQKLVSSGVEGLRKFGPEAHRAMHENWSATRAAQRTIALSGELMRSELSQARELFSSGVCSSIDS